LGHYNRNKIAALIICLVVTGLFIHCFPRSNNRVKNTTLSHAVESLEGWHSIRHIPVEDTIIKALNLDDYIYQTFSKKQKTVSLYIGYYLSSSKIGEAHSPLVCFPGQGWTLSNKTSLSFIVDQDTIHFAQMTAERNDRKELILYWFQAFDKTSPGTFMQKINTLHARLLHQREDNAFVRLTIPIEKNEPTQALLTGEQFIEAFYPHFLKFVRQ